MTCFIIPCNILALSFDYGQRHKFELDAAKKIAQHNTVHSFQTIDIDLKQFGKSALTDEIAVPKNQEIGNDIPVWKTALNQVRPYLSLIDAFNAVNFILRKNIFGRETFNLVTSNLTVKNIISKIGQTNKKRIKIKLVDSKIMNQLSYKVSRKKFEKTGFTR